MSSSAREFYHPSQEKWTIELPNYEREDYCFEVLKTFSSKKEALDWAKENLGADEEGKINIIGHIN